MKFDDIIEYIGQFGPYQKRIYALVCLPSITIALQAMATVFTMAIPDHRCALPDLQNDTFAAQNAAHAEAINFSIPADGDISTGYSQCDIYDIDLGTWSSSLTTTYENHTSSSLPLAPPGTKACRRWVYDQSTFSSTLVTELDLVCEEKMGRSHTQMFYFLGSLLGALLLGPPADFFGRKKLMLVCIVLHVGASLAMAFTPNLPYLYAFMCLNGMSATALYCVLFVLGMELVGPKKRTYAGYVIVIFFGVGVIILSGLAYFIRDWQTLQLTISSVSVVFISYYWLIPESPRWLISKERYSEAEIIIKRAAKRNKKEIPAKILQFDNLNIQEEKEIHEPLWRIITYPRLVLRTLIIYLNWTVCSMTYYGLGLNVGDLAGSIYVNSLLYGAVETLSYIVCMFLLDKIGRRKLYLGTVFLAGLACSASPFPYIFGGPDYQWLTVVFAILGKFGVSAAFATIWLYTGELFPTVVRNSGVSSSSLCARIGGIISPYIANMSVTIGGDLGQILPLLIFGGFSMLAGTLSLLLPETKNEQLPETLRDANEFGRSCKPSAMHVTELESLNSAEDKMKQNPRA